MYRHFAEQGLANNNEITNRRELNELNGSIGYSEWNELTAHEQSGNGFASQSMAKRVSGVIKNRTVARALGSSGGPASGSGRAAMAK